MGGDFLRSRCRAQAWDISKESQLQDSTHPHGRTLSSTSRLRHQGAGSVGWAQCQQLAGPLTDWSSGFHGPRKDGFLPSCGLEGGGGNGGPGSVVVAAVVGPEGGLELVKSGWLSPLSSSWGQAALWGFGTSVHTAPTARM